MKLFRKQTDEPDQKGKEMETLDEEALQHVAGGADDTGGKKTPTDRKHGDTRILRDPDD